MQAAADLYAEKEKSLYIMTCKGRKFHIAEPTFDIEEIAHALSHQCRYTGHTSTFYSVAEHCIIVSRMCEDLASCQLLTGNVYLPKGEAAYEGFMHDAHEAYVSDIASPWKVLIPDYRAMEGKLELEMRRWAKLPDRISEGVKLADWLALFVEANHLFPPGTTDDWLTPSPVFRDLLKPVIHSGHYRPEGWGPEYCRNEYMKRYFYLKDMML